MDKKYYIYMHVNKENQKKYIGMSCQKTYRRFGKNGVRYAECPKFWSAIQEYGWTNFEHKILLSGLSYEEACEKEIEMIALYDTTNDKYGYNTSKGGNCDSGALLSQKWKDECFHKKMCDSMKEAWKDSEKRQRRSDIARERWEAKEFKEQTKVAIRKSIGRAVLCVETGIVYPTRIEASEALGICGANISRACKKGYLCGGFHWKYANDVS